MIKQQVNLFLELPQKPKQSPIVNYLKPVSLLYIFILLGLYSYQTWQRYSETSLVAELEQQQQVFQNQIGEVTARYSDILNEEELTSSLGAELGLLEDEVQAKAQLIERLRQTRIQAGRGFSIYFRGFSEQMLDNIWLSHINITESGLTIAFNGTATNAASVPELIDNLGQNPAFEDKEFKEFHIKQSRLNRSYVDFSVGSIKKDSELEEELNELIDTGNTEN